MICSHCAWGADLKTELLPDRRNGADVTATNRYNGLVRRINNAHGKCKGCDCQHAGTPHYRPPSREPSVFRYQPALVTSPVMSAEPAKRRNRHA